MSYCSYAYGGYFVVAYACSTDERVEKETQQVQ